MNLADKIRVFLESCPDDYRFPLKAGDDLVKKNELELAEALACCDVREQDLAPLRNLSLDMAYDLRTFAVRISVYAARVGDPQYLEASCLCLSVDDGVVDWRDILVACSIVEDCGHRLDLDIRQQLARIADIATPRRRHTLVQGYLSRKPQMRRPETMGYTAKIGKRGLYYEKL